MSHHIKPGDRVKIGKYGKRIWTVISAADGDDTAFVGTTAGAIRHQDVLISKLIVVEKAKGASE